MATTKDLGPKYYATISSKVPKDVYDIMLLMGDEFVYFVFAYNYSSRKYKKSVTYTIVLLGIKL